MTKNCDVPTVMVPVRCVVPLFASTWNVTDPVPIPVLPVGKVIHCTLLVAAHAHPLGAMKDAAVVTAPEPRK